MAKNAPPARLGRYERLESVGNGSFGFVYACRSVDALPGSSQRWAIKVLDLRRLRLKPDFEKEHKKMMRELNILQKLPAHQNVVAYHGFGQEAHWFYLVLELVKGGDLFAVLYKRLPKPFHESEVAYVFRQLVEGLKFLHGQNIIHRDLKPENVLVVAQHDIRTIVLFDVKIADFGLSKEVGEGLSEARSRVGTERYQAPEVLMNKPYDFRVDCWSLGVLIYVLLTGRYKPQQHTWQLAIENVGCNDELRSALIGLLQIQAELRWTLAHLDDGTVGKWLSKQVRTVIDEQDGQEPSRKRSRRELSGSGQHEERAESHSSRAQSDGLFGSNSEELFGSATISRGSPILPKSIEHDRHCVTGASLKFNNNRRNVATDSILQGEPITIAESSDMLCNDHSVVSVD